MTNPVPGEVLRLLADLDEAVTAVIDKHLTTNSKYLQHYAPIGVNVTTVDGVLASLMEEGVDIYPEVEKVEAGERSFSLADQEKVAEAIYYAANDGEGAVVTSDFANAGEFERRTPLKLAKAALLAVSK